MDKLRLTKAQRLFLRRHTDGEILGRYDRGVISGPVPTYDFVGRCRDAGWIDIIDGEHSGWPYTWVGTRITPAGRRSIEENGR